MRRAPEPGGGAARSARREVDEELDFHLDAVAEELVREGWPPGEARLEAERRFGDLVFTREWCAEATARRRRREGWTMRTDEIRQDLAYAVRTLGRSPGYAAVVAGTLALAIAAISTIFGVMSPYFVRPLPYGEPDRLVQLGLVDAESGWDGGRLSMLQTADVAERARSLESVGHYAYGSRNLADGGAPERVQAAFLSGDLFDVLGVDAALGRTFGPADAGPSGQPVVVLSDALWRARYGADPGIVGATVRLDGQPHTVVGVMGPRFNFPFNGIRLWVPDRRDPAELGRERGNQMPVARLADGWTLEAARQELAAVHAGLAAEHPEVDGRWDGLAATPLREALNFAWEPLRVGFALMLGAVGFLYLIACVNVAGLALARGTARESEVAVRTALGAGRGRILRQLLTESLVLAALAGAVGVGLAAVAVDLVAPLLPEDLYRVGDASMDGRVLLFSLAVTLVAPLVSGLAPAVVAVRTDLSAAMKAGGGAGEGRAALRGRRALVVAQVALALVLVAGAGVMVRAFLSIRALELGHDPSRVVVAEVTPPPFDYAESEDVEAYFDRAVERLRAVPGVEAVGQVAWLPMNHETLVVPYARPGSAGDAEAWPSAVRNRVGADYFAAMDVELLAGRGFTDADGPGAPPVAVVGRRAAEALWPEGGAVGSTILLGRDGAEALAATVVGVVEDVQHSDRLGERGPTVYRPLRQEASRRRFLVARAAGRPEPLVRPVREALLEVDPDLPFLLRPMSEVARESTVAFSLGAALLGGFGAMALLLASLGLSGLLAYTVARRRRELAVRLALGATPGRLRGMVVGDGLRLVGIGAGIGLVLAVALGRLVAASVPWVDATDPLTLAAVLALFGAVAAAASGLPAVRGAVDASGALRSE